MGSLDVTDVVAVQAKYKFLQVRKQVEHLDLTQHLTREIMKDLDVSDDGLGERFYSLGICCGSHEFSSL